MAKGIAAVTAKAPKAGLRGTVPSTTINRAKFLLYGQASVGKTTAALQFPKPYVIDAERGTEPYGELVEKQGGAVFMSSDLKAVWSEIELLATEEHDFQTLVIDPFTNLYNQMVEVASKRAQGSLVWMEAKKMWTNFISHAMKPDMNLIVVCHGKNEYAEGQLMKKIGETWDGPRGLIYAFDLALHLTKEGSKRYAHVVKTRLTELFPEESSFPWSYKEFENRFGKEKLNKLNKE